ncbi:MAG: 6-phosphogluconolactonase [Armatimonadota bacterium]
MKPIRYNSVICKTSKDAACEFVWRFASLANQYIYSKGYFNVALPGGSSPLEAFNILSTEYRTSLNWDKINIFFTDERDVDKNDPLSNYRLVKERLIDTIGIPENNVFRFKTDISPEDSAKDYQDIIIQKTNGIGKLDAVFLGMGEDSHTASLFPHHKSVQENKLLAVSEYIDKISMYRLTLTPRTINSAENVIMYTLGESKCVAVRDCLQGVIDINLHPAQVLNPDSCNVLWILDQESAKLL